MRLRGIVSIIATGIIVAVCSMASGATGSQPPGKLGQEITTAAERAQHCSLSAGEVAVLDGADGAAASQMAERMGIAGKTVAGGGHFVSVEADAAGVDFDDPSIAPVFRAGSGPNAPFLFPNGEVIVKFKVRTTEKQAASWGAVHGLTLVRPMVITNTFLLKAASPSKGLAAAARGATSHKVVFCVPNWMRQRVLRQSDPLYPYQWHLKNTGAVKGTVAGNDINVESAWTTYRGSASQIVCIVDDGLEIAHKDLAANIVAGLSWDFVDKKDDPTAGDHGTA